MCAAFQPDSITTTGRTEDSIDINTFGSILLTATLPLAFPERFTFPNFSTSSSFLKSLVDHPGKGKNRTRYPPHHTPMKEDTRIFALRVWSVEAKEHLKRSDLGKLEESKCFWEGPIY